MYSMQVKCFLRVWRERRLSALLQNLQCSLQTCDLISCYHPENPYGQPLCLFLAAWRLTCMKASVGLRLFLVFMPLVCLPQGLWLMRPFCLPLPPPCG